MAYSVTDYIGKELGKWTIVEDAGRDKNNHCIVKCRCKCGKEGIIRLTDLVNCRTKQCSECSRHDRKYKIPDITKSRLYGIWGKMKFRCYNPKDTHYKYYGERGISVCDEWRNDFLAFRSWALDHGYKDDLTIDRINNNGNYEPSNCRWVTKTLQAINRGKFNGSIHQNRSGYIGVILEKGRSKWSSYLRRDRKTIYLGSYKTQKEALAARNNYIIAHGIPYAIQEYVGELCTIERTKKLSVLNKSGYSGIIFDKWVKKWRATVSKVRIGFYSTKREAVEARNEYILKNNIDYPIQDYKDEIGSIAN